MFLSLSLLKSIKKTCPPQVRIFFKKHYSEKRYSSSFEGEIKCFILTRELTEILGLATEGFYIPFKIIMKNFGLCAPNAIRA